VVITEGLIKNRTRLDSIIFDIDGVLIDTSISFSGAVIKAVQNVLSSNNIKISENELFAMLYKIKSAEGFNNDWDCAEALLVFNLQKNLSKKPLSLEKYLSSVTNISEKQMDIKLWVSKQDNRELNRKIFSILDSCCVRRIAMEFYAGQDFCKKFYGFDPQGFASKGTHIWENTIVDIDLLKQIKCVKGIYTGRNKYELDLALKKINFYDWNNDFLFYDNEVDSGYKKPSPFPLAECIDSLNSKGLLYIGDSPDDLRTFINLKKIRQDKNIEFVMIKSAINSFKNHEEFDISIFENINQLLSFLILGR